MKSIYILMASLLLLTSTSFAQFKNQKTETYKVFGNCNTCKKNIENNGSKKNEAKVVWNVDTEIATLTYDASKTNGEEILKRIAIAGYDNEKFLAPDDAYNKLDSCCQYDRKEEKSSIDHTKMNHGKMVMSSDHSNMNHKQSSSSSDHSSMNHKQSSGSSDHSSMNHKQSSSSSDHSSMNHKTMTSSTELKKQPKSNELSLVVQNYDNLKNSFITADEKKINNNATELLKSIQAVQMSNLTNDEHLIWMQIQQNLISNTEKISKSKNITKKREAFSVLSQDVYKLLKASKLQNTVYYMHCPMFNNGQGANWLSSENEIKNPYYGLQMINCGSIVETIK